MIRRGVVAVAVLVALAGAGAAALEPSALSGAQALAVEAHRLRVENAQLRMSVATLRAELDSLKLTAERQALEAEIRKATNADPADVFDWAAGRFTRPPGGQQ
jgi:hypothetical protein